MAKPVVLQVEFCPDWGREPINATSHAKRLFEAEDNFAFSAERSSALA